VQIETKHLNFLQVKSLRTYYGDLLVNFDYDLTEDLSLKANAGVNTQDRYSRATSQGGQNLDISWIICSK
jgi:hypothetical protein